MNIELLLLPLWFEVLSLQHLTQGFYVLTDKTLKDLLTVGWFLILKDLLGLGVQLLYFLFYSVMNAVVEYFENVVLFLDVGLDVFEVFLFGKILPIT